MTLDPERMCGRQGTQWMFLHTCGDASTFGFTGDTRQGSVLTLFFSTRPAVRYRTGPA